MTKFHGRKLRTQLLTSVALSAGLIVAPASAQDQNSDDGGYALEEIMVTAQKRETTLQQTPVAASVVSGDTLALAQTRDLRDMQFLVPSLQVVKRASASNTTFSIRGISSSSFNFGLEPAVGVFVDGVYRSRNGASVNDYLGLERVEVLRGPQSVLFGKNTTAGVISFTTKAPHYETEVEGEVTYGNYGAVVLKGALNLPIQEDKLAIRLDVNFNNRDGVINNATTGGALNEVDRYGLRGQILFEPKDNIKLRVIADYNDLDEECCAAPFFDIDAGTQATLTALGSGITGPGVADRITATDKTDIRAQLETKGISAQLDVEFDGFDLTSITAYREYDELNDFDADFTDLPLNKSRITDQSYETFTQEIRLTSTGDNTVDWMVGAYYLDQDLSTNNITLQGPLLRPFIDGFMQQVSGGLLSVGFFETVTGVPTGTYFAEGSGQLKSLFNQSNQTYAAFATADWHINEKLTLTGGLRYSYDKKSVVSDIVTDDPFADLDLVALGAAVLGDPTALAGFSAVQFQPSAPNINDERSDSVLTGNVIVNYDMSEELNLYASYTRGFKGGGFSLDSAAARVGSFSFEDESVDAFEVGVKARLLDNRLSLDFALYQNDIHDFQANLFIDTSFLPGNVPEIRVRGLEFDGKFQATPNLLLTAGFNWLITGEYVEFPNGPCPVSRPDVCTLRQAPGSTVSTAVGDLAGFRLGETARFTGNMSATYIQPISDDLQFLARGELYYTSEQNLTIGTDDRERQPGYALVAASIGIGAQDGSWGLQIWGRNLFDENYVYDTFGATIPGSSLQAYVGDPRTYGLTLSFKY